MGKIIALEGGIGVGKSYFLEVIKRNFSNVKIFNEGLDQDIYKKIVKDYYERPIEKAYSFQLTMLWRKMADGLDAQEYADTGGIALIERTISSNAKVFCEIARKYGYLEDHEYKVYQHAYNKLKKPLRRPDKMIYLNCPVEMAYGRINDRGRGGENNISLEYLKTLDRLYLEWFENYKGDKKSIYFTRNLEEEELIEILEGVIND